MRPFKLDRPTVADLLAWRFERAPATTCTNPGSAPACLSGFVPCGFRAREFSRSRWSC